MIKDVPFPATDAADCLKSENVGPSWEFSYGAVLKMQV